MNQERQQQEQEERRRHTEEAAWLDMGHQEITDFMVMHPTYFMDADQASDWYAGVERGIRRNLNKFSDPAQWDADYDARLSPPSYSSHHSEPKGLK